MGTVEISYKISYPYIGRCNFYTTLIEFLNVRAQKGSSVSHVILRMEVTYIVCPLCLTVGMSIDSVKVNFANWIIRSMSLFRCVRTEVKEMDGIAVAKYITLLQMLQQ